MAMRGIVEHCNIVIKLGYTFGFSLLNGWII